MINIVIAIFEILVGIGIIGFWILFYFTEYKNPKKMSEVKFKHEKSFPLPDLGWVLPCLTIAALGLLMEQKFGYFFSALAGSGMIFLGLIDFAFNFQNGEFKKEGFDKYISAIIVILMLTFGPIFIIYGGLNL